MDEYRFSLPRLWIAVGAICVLDIMQVVPMLGHRAPHLAALGRLSPALAGFLLIYGHLILAAAWLAVFVLALKFHGLRALWMLLALIVILPGSLIWWIMWICATRGSCL